MDLSRTLAERLNLRPQQVSAAVDLLDGGNTLPFIARYRKEVTGGLDEEQLRQLAEGLKLLRALEERRQSILESVREQGKLTPDLEARLAQAQTLTALEDLYLPYRPKRKTRAGMAREKGLSPLADRILLQAPGGDPVERQVQPFLSEACTTVDEALQGARDIVAETVSEHADVRRVVREKALRFGTVSSKRVGKTEDPRAVFATYYDFSAQVGRLRPHQVLALDRGETEKVLRISFDLPERDWRDAIAAVFRPNPRSPWAEQLHLAVQDAADRLLLPAIERDVRRTLTEQAHQHAISIFATNLRALLSTPPLAGHTVLGLDPGFRTGCKVAVVDSTGKVLATTTVFLHQEREALRTLAALVLHHGVSLITIGNGTASRETEQLVATLVRELKGKRELAYLIVNEAGASVYSASPLARAELPDLDVTLRGAVSIARRVQDPLAELVKIEPRSIGVGMYQHDVDQSRLTEALGGVVESVVNRVGVDVNTASPALLTYVAGIGPKLAEKVVAHRDKQGPFPERKALLKVSGLGPKAFEQAAGFLRIRGGKNPLDQSAIHPESYPVAEAVLRAAGLTTATPPADRAAALAALTRSKSLADLARELGTGEPTLKDILEQLVRPGRDPREDLDAPQLRQDVLSMDDLKPGMRLSGTVRNVVDFGAFVDIGVKQDGLLHRSQIPRGESLSVGEVREVEVLSVDQQRGRISLALPV
ncbi:MAG: Tex family protein [Candidatus Eremiobacterota bacterium]